MSETPSAGRRRGGNWRTIIDANVRGGYYFFSDGAMAGFNCQLIGEPKQSLNNRLVYFFVTGERMYESDPLLYTVRRIDISEGEVESASEFQQFDNKTEALRSMRISAALWSEETK